MSRFVITGAGGFLGSQLVHHLLAHTDHSVVAVSSQDQGAVRERVDVVGGRPIDSAERLDVLTNTSLLNGDVLAAGDVVVHGAFPWNRSGAEVAHGLDFQRDVFTVAARSNIATFINISSQSVYPSDRTAPASEGSGLDLSTPYAVAKYSMELLASAILAPETLINVRMGSLIGRGYDVRIVNRFIAQALAGQPLVVKEPDRLFSYLDVRDASRALTLIGELGVQEGVPVVNVGTESQVSLEVIAREAARAAGRVSGQRVPVIVEEVQGNGGGPVASYGLDCRLASTAYGFRAALDVASTSDWIAGGTSE